MENQTVGIAGGSRRTTPQEDHTIHHTIFILFIYFY